MIAKARGIFGSALAVAALALAGLGSATGPAVVTVTGHAAANSTSTSSYIQPSTPLTPSDHITLASKKKHR